VYSEASLDIAGDIFRHHVQEALLVRRGRLSYFYPEGVQAWASTWKDWDASKTRPINLRIKAGRISPKGKDSARPTGHLEGPDSERDAHRDKGKQR